MAKLHWTFAATKWTRSCNSSILKLILCINLCLQVDMFKSGLNRWCKPHIEHAQFRLASPILAWACAGGFAMMFADPRLAPPTVRSLVPITHLFSWCGIGVHTATGKTAGFHICLNLGFYFFFFTSGLILWTVTDLKDKRKKKKKKSYSLTELGRK